MVTSSITRNLRQNGGQRDLTQTCRSLKMTADQKCMEKVEEVPISDLK